MKHLKTELAAKLPAILDDKDQKTICDALLRLIEPHIKGHEEEGERQHELEDAILHLQEVVRHTEEATLCILSAAAVIQQLAPHDAAISNQVTSIYNACTFQDISAQRINKVMRLLAVIQKNGDMGAVVNKSSSKKSKKALTREELMAGPQLPGDAPTQEMIDKMFRDNN